MKKRMYIMLAPRRGGVSMYKEQLPVTRDYARGVGS